jgi:hypothetical protein
MPHSPLNESSIPLTTMYHMLQNPYYIGVVPYREIHYEGKRPPIVEPETWLAVQDILAAHNQTGEKDRKHNHYLRSTVYCSSCGARLVFSQHKGNGGTYAYFQCLKKKTKQNNCQRPAVRVESIEQGVLDFYAQFTIKPEVSAAIKAGVNAALASQRADAESTLRRALKRRETIESERKVLLRAHYAGAVPQDLLASEMQRFTRELAQVDGQIKSAKVATTDVTATLNAALRAAERCENAYATAPPHIRRQINRGFFKKLWITEDGTVERSELNEPFATLLANDRPLVGVQHQHHLELEAGKQVSAVADESREQPTQSRQSVVLRNMISNSTESDDTNTDRKVFLAVRGCE